MIREVNLSKIRARQAAEQAGESAEEAAGAGITSAAERAEGQNAAGRVKPPYDDFYRTYSGQILAYLKRHMSSEAEAEDLHSEIFLYCYKNYDKYDPSKAAPSTWVYLITKSRYKNYLRDRKETADIDGMEIVADTGEDPAEKAAYVEELRRNLCLALQEMTERQRTIVVLKYFKGMETEEIAERLGISPNNVRVQLSKTLKKMQPLMEGYR